MTITARYAGTCSRCGGRIAPGQSIEWARGCSSRHTTCPAPEPALPTSGPVSYETVKAFLQATPEARDKYLHSDRDGYDRRHTRYCRCPECGQGGYLGQYPFSTYGGDICDDCGA